MDLLHSRQCSRSKEIAWGVSKEERILRFGHNAPRLDIFFLVTNTQKIWLSKTNNVQEMAQKKSRGSKCRPARYNSTNRHPQQCVCPEDSCENSSRGRQLTPVKLQLPSSC